MSQRPRRRIVRESDDDLPTRNPPAYRSLTASGPMKRQDFLVTFGPHHAVLAAFEHPGTGEITLALRKATP